MSIADSELWFASQSDRSVDRTGCDIDDGRVLASGIEGENTAGKGIIDRPVGARTDGDGARGLESRRIEDDNFVSGARRGESLAEPDRDLMRAGDIGNVANGFIRLGVEDHHVAAMRDEQMPADAIECDRVPERVAAKRHGIHEVNARTLRARGERRQEQASYAKHDLQSRHCFLPKTSALLCATLLVLFGYGL